MQHHGQNLYEPQMDKTLVSWYNSKLAYLAKKTS